MNVQENSKVHQVYLGLGSNINPRENLPRAVAILRKQVRLLGLSTVWESPPDGSMGPDFLNAAALIETDMAPDALRQQVLRPIEARLGRVRTADPNAPRTIDLDILVYDRDILDQEVWQRVYLAVPLAELVPDLPHPQSGENLSDIAGRLMQSIPIQPRRDVFLHNPRIWEEGFPGG